jgi:hypothetical protein
MKVIVREMVEPYSKTGVAWRAFEEDGTPLYIGAETRAELEARVREFHPSAVFQVEPAPSPSTASGSSGSR